MDNLEIKYNSVNSHQELDIGQVQDLKKKTQNLLVSVIWHQVLILVEIHEFEVLESSL